MSQQTLTGSHEAPHKDAGARLEFVVVAIAVFLSPMNYFRPGFIYFTLGDFFMILAFGVMLVRNRVPLRPLGAATGLWFASTLIFLLGFTISSVVNGNAVDGSVGVLQYCFSFVILPCILLRRTMEETQKLLLIFAIAITLAMIHGSYYVNVSKGLNEFSSATGRLRGVFERENEAGALAAYSIVFLLWLRATHRIGLIVLFLLVPPLLYGLLLTGSNSAFYLLILGVGLFVILTGSVRATAGMFIGATAFFVAAILFGEHFLPEVFLKRVFSAVQDGDLSESGTLDERVFLIYEALGVGNRTVWVGLGMDQYEHQSSLGAAVHNVYLLTLTEGGMMSLIGLAGIFCACYFVIWRYRMFFGNAKNTALSLTVLVMMPLILNTSPHFYGRFWFVPWMLGLSVCLTGRVISKPHAEADDAPEQPDHWLDEPDLMGAGRKVY